VTSLIVVVFIQDDYSLSPTVFGRIASYYYLSHLTVRMFREKLTSNTSIPELITILAVRFLFLLVLCYYFRYLKFLAGQK